MMEWVTANSGARVPRWKGRLLASRLDPKAEAAEWLRGRTRFLERVKTVFVLGVGGGFHIAAVLERFAARVIVIEPEAELAMAVMPELLEKFTGRVELVNVIRAADLRSNEAVREGLRESFTVLEHPASIAGAREFFSASSALLGAREWGALTWQWKLKGFPDLDSEPRVAGGERALTIYDLEQTELVRESSEKEKLLLRALRELVK